MSWDWPYFTAAEMQCRCGCKGLPRDELMIRLVAMREEAGFPFVISSGFRCPEYNRTVSNTGDSGPHTTGLAVDVRVAGERAFRLVGLAIKHGMTGLGISQKGEGRFVHLDCIQPGGGYPRPWVWSY